MAIKVPGLTIGNGVVVNYSFPVSASTDGTSNILVLVDPNTLDWGTIDDLIIGSGLLGGYALLDGSNGPTTGEWTFGDNVNITGELDVTGKGIFGEAIIIGNTNDDLAGTIRFDGVDFEAFDGTAWHSLTTSEVDLDGYALLDGSNGPTTGEWEFGESVKIDDDLEVTGEVEVAMTTNVCWRGTVGFDTNGDWRIRLESGDMVMETYVVDEWLEKLRITGGPLP